MEYSTKQSPDFLINTQPDPSSMIETMWEPFANLKFNMSLLIGDNSRLKILVIAESWFELKGVTSFGSGRSGKHTKRLWSA